MRNKKKLSKKKKHKRKIAEMGTSIYKHTKCGKREMKIKLHISAMSRNYSIYQFATGFPLT
jgi:hypothetical protein